MRSAPALATIVALAASPGIAAAAPIFADWTPNLGSPQPCASMTNPSAEGCYTHYVLFADLNGDHALDIVFAGGGGYYVPGQPAPLIVYLNDGTGHFQEVNASLFGGYTARTRQIAVGDIDGDGDLDIFVPEGYGSQPDALFVNDGHDPPTFTNEAAERIGTTSHAGATRFADVDGDGALDLVITDWGASPPASPGTARIYLNDGAGHFKEKVGAVPQDTSAIGTGPIDIDLVDIDGDFDLDLVVASRLGNSLLFLNDGKGNFTLAPHFPKQPGPYVYGPDACDIDGDGDLDLILDNGLAAGSVQVLVNDGHGHFADETAARVEGNVGTDDNKVQCVDIDGDGDFDFVVASLQGSRERVFENDGTGHFKLREWDFPAVSDSTLGLDLGDVDGDHVLDVVTAQGESGPFLNRLYGGIAPQRPDTRPPAFRAVQRLGSAGQKVALRFAVTDQTTTDTGPRLTEAHVEVDGASVPAVFVGGDLFQAFIDVHVGSRYRPCATDWAGHAGCGEFVTVGSEASGSGGGGSGAGGASASASGSGGDATSGGNGSSGCGCSMRETSTEGGLTLVAVVALGVARRRRRGRAHCRKVHGP